MGRSIYIFLFCGVLICALCIFTYQQADAKEKVVLQLSWKHQFQFAGYYAAIEKGFYDEAGFEVEIREMKQDLSVVEEILNGNAQFAIGDAEILADFFNGSPIILLASIFQHSPSVLMVKETSDIRTPQDVAGKILMVGEGLNGLEILTMIYSEGVKKDDFTIVPQSFSVNDLLSDKVDGLGAYISNEPYFMEKFGIPFRIINPTSYGIDFYSDCLFCSSQLLRSKPERVNKFREATIKGWEYALSNQEEIAYLIVNKYNSSKTIDHLLYEAGQIEKLINPDFIEIGHTNKWRWQKIAEYLFQMGIIDNVSNVDEFIYSHKLSNRYLWLKIIGIIALSFLVITLISFIFIHRLNQSVQIRTQEMQLLVRRLEEQNNEIHKINLSLIKARDTAKETEENRVYFYSKIVNELRNPVNSLLDLSEKACNPNITDEKKKSICARIGFNSKIVHDFINDIIAISNTSDDLKANNLEVFSFIDLLTSILSRIKKENIISNGITLHHELNLENPQTTVLVNHEMLYRILSKLVNNSLKFTEQGQIEIGCEKLSPTSLMFWVKDTGHGIKPDLVRKLNEFFSNPLGTNTAGIGLGLWVSKALVQQMNGNMWVESEYGKNSSFFMQIPCTYVESTDLDESAITDHLITDQKFDIKKLNKKNVLVLDDNFTNYNLILMLARGSGLSLLYADNLNDALSIIKSSNLVDLMLVNTDDEEQGGYNPILEIRKINSTIPVVAYLLKEVKDKKVLIDLGCSDVILIPTSNNQLIEKISNLLKG